MTDTLLDKADALMRRRGFNANLKPAETSDALPEIQELSGDDTPSAPLAMELNEDEDKETALQSAPALSTAEECLEPAQSGHPHTHRYRTNRHASAEHPLHRNRTSHPRITPGT